MADTERIVLSFDIDTFGAPHNIALLEVSNPCFLAASIDAVKRWRYPSVEEVGENAFQKDRIVTFRFAKE